MTPTAPDWQAVLSRLDRMEAQTRWWKVAAVAACFLAGAALLAAPAISQERAAREVRAERFVLVDAEGRERGELAMAVNPLMARTRQLMIDQGVELPPLDLAPALVLRDAGGKSRARLEFDPGGDPRLGLYDENENRRVELGVGIEGNPQIHLYDVNEKLRVRLAFSAEGDPMLGFHDANEQRRVNLLVGQDIGGSLRFQDATGQVTQVYPPGEGRER